MNGTESKENRCNDTKNSDKVYTSSKDPIRTETDQIIKNKDVLCNP